MAQGVVIPPFRSGVVLNPSDAIQAIPAGTYTGATSSGQVTAQAGLALLDGNEEELVVETGYSVTVGDLLKMVSATKVAPAGYKVRYVAKTAMTYTTVSEFIVMGDNKYMFISATAARVITVSDAGVITLGTATTLSYTGARCCVIGTDKVLAVASNSGVFASVLSVTGTTISKGSWATVSSGTSDGDFGVCQLDADKALILFRRTSTTLYSKIIVATVSGTTVSVGTAVSLVTSDYSSFARLIQNGTDKCVIYHMTYSGKVTNAVPISVSGTVPTIGTALQVSTYDHAGNADVIDLTNGYHLMVWKSATSAITAQCFSSNGSTVTAGTSITAADKGTYYLDMVRISNSLVIMFHQPSGGLYYYATVLQYDGSGNVTSLGTCNMEQDDYEAAVGYVRNGVLPTTHTNRVIGYDANTDYLYLLELYRQVDAVAMDAGNAGATITCKKLAP